MSADGLKRALAAFAAILAMGASVAESATIPTRQINGVYTHSPVLGTIFWGASMLTRLNPWVVTVAGIGVSVARIIIDGMDGTSIPVTTRGLADAERTPVTNPTQNNYQQCWSRDGWVSAIPGPATYCYGSQSATKDAWLAAATAAGGTNCRVDTQTGSAGWSGSGEHFLLYYICDNWGGTNSISLGVQGYNCGGMVYGSTAAAIAACGAPTAQLQGGTKSWAPRQVTDPYGQSQWGWEKPSDPLVPDYGWGPSGTTLEFPREAGAPANSPAPQVTLTPGTDGGYTIQTWSPNFVTNGANQVVQNGWTVQTMTVNNAGNVTNTSIVVNNTSGPTTGNAPIVDAGQAPNPTDQQQLKCGSLSCETTQQAIRTELEAAAAPTMPDQAARVTAAKGTDQEKFASVPAEILAGKTSDMALWPALPLPIPSGSCSLPVAHVLTWTIDLSQVFCEKVDWFRALVGYLFAIYAAWGIWNLMTKRPA